MENIFFDKRDLKYCGNNVIIGKTVRIRRPQEVVIEDNVIIDDFTYIPCALEIGKFTHIGANCSMIGGGGSIKIGSFVNIAPSCQIITGTENYKGGGLEGPAIPKEYADPPIIKPIFIGNHALLGCNTTVMPGAVVPEGMATGAFSLVLEQQYEPWSLYMGIPIKYYCPREGTEIKATAQRLIKDLYN